MRSRRRLQSVCNCLQDQTLNNSRSQPHVFAEVADFAAVWPDACVLHCGGSGLLYELRLQSHRANAVDFTVDVVIAVDQPDLFHFGSPLDDC